MAPTFSPLPLKGREGGKTSPYSAARKKGRSSFLIPVLEGGGWRSYSISETYLSTIAERQRKLFPSRTKRGAIIGRDEELLSSLWAGRKEKKGESTAIFFEKAAGY